MLDKYAMKQKFQNGVVTVVFEKRDGTERTLKGTLLAEYLPQVPVGEQEEISDARQNDNTLAVWDTENNGWRSFRLDSVKQVLSE